MRDVSSTRQEAVMAEIRSKLARKHGTAAADRYMAPLCWYLQSGRMPLDILVALCSATPRQQAVLANRLAKGGSDEEAIDRIVDYLVPGWSRGA